MGLNKQTNINGSVKQGPKNQTSLRLIKSKLSKKNFIKKITKDQKQLKRNTLTFLHTPASKNCKIQKYQLKRQSKWYYFVKNNNQQQAK